MNFFPESRRFPRPIAAGAAITIVYLVLAVESAASITHGNETR